MKKILLFLILGSFNVWAQSDVNPTEPNPEEVGAIVKPTTVQKNSVDQAAKKATKSESLKLNEELSEKKVANPSTIWPHFGLHADLNVPHVLNYGLDYWHSSQWFSTALNFGGYSVSGVAKNSDVPNGLNIKIANQDLMLRWHPAKGSFYVGLGYGSHAITVETKQTITVTSPFPGSADVEISDEIKANYLLPHVGWLWRLPVGLTFGIDLGYLSPISPSVDLKSNVSNISNPLVTKGDIEATTEYKNARRDLIDKSEQFGKMGLPYWTVFRVGWLF